MSSHVHTSVWLSNLPSPTRAAHTDTPSAQPDRPGCQRMKGREGRSGRMKKMWERKYNRIQGHKHIQVFYFKHQAALRSSSTPRTPPMDCYCSFIWMQCGWKLFFHCVLWNMPFTNVTAAFPTCNPANNNAEQKKKQLCAKGCADKT